MADKKIYLMIDKIKFPPVSSANEDGLLAMGGELNNSTLVSAYAQGIFPWFNEGQPILWWSPNPRLVLYPHNIKVSRSLRKTIKRNDFRITSNRAFEQVIDGCALRGLNNQLSAPEDTWITQDMRKAYIELHQSGFAHSVEVWLNQELVGGLYGLALGNIFFGESMFSDINDSSKVALFALCKKLHKLKFTLIDCQVSSEHLFSLGAQEITRDAFLEHLGETELLAIRPDISITYQSKDLLREKKLL